MEMTIVNIRICPLLMPSFRHVKSLILPPDKCEEGLSIHKEGDCWGVFTYVSAEAISGAEVSFTTPHITGFEACDGKEYTVNQGRGRGANTVLTWTGEITTCGKSIFLCNWILIATEIMPDLPFCRLTLRSMVYLKKEETIAISFVIITKKNIILLYRGLKVYIRFFVRQTTFLSSVITFD